MNGSRGCRPISWLANAALASLALACAATHSDRPLGAGRGAAGATGFAAGGGAGAEHLAAGAAGGAANGGAPAPAAGDGASAGQAGSSITLPAPADCSPACGPDQRCEQRQTFCARSPCATQPTPALTTRSARLRALPTTATSRTRRVRCPHRFATTGPLRPFPTVATGRAFRLSTVDASLSRTVLITRRAIGRATRASA